MKDKIIKKLSKIRLGEFGHFESMNILRSFGASLIGVYVPIKLLNDGFSINTVFFYLSGVYGFFVLFLPFAIYVYQKIGVKSTMSISLVSRPFLFLYTIYVTDNKSLLILTVLSALNMVLYWPGHFFMQNRSIKEKNIDSRLALIKIISKLVQTSSPLIAGLILATLGQKYIFIVGGVVTALSIIPLLTDSYIHSKPKFSFKTLKLIPKGDNFKKTVLQFIVRGVELSIGGVVWGIYLYITTGSLIKSGLIYTISFLVSIIFIYLSGKYIKKFKSIHSLGAIFSGIHWIAKGVFTNIIVLSGIQISHDLTQDTLSLSLSSKENHQAKHSHHKYHYFLWREFILNLVKSMTFLVLAFFPLLQPAIVGLGFLSWLYILI